MREQFTAELGSVTSEDGLLDFCRKTTLHGLPAVFKGDENAYYEFRKRISQKFDVTYLDVIITGSAKLGFSPHKEKIFDLDSDIDVSIISASLFDRLMEHIHHYQMQLRENRRAVTDKEINVYHKFLEYVAIGWIRPDLLPISFQVDQIKADWFDFFKSISHGKSEVGNYKVSAGVFKSYSCLERYILSGYSALWHSIKMGSI